MAKTQYQIKVPIIVPNFEGQMHVNEELMSTGVNGHETIVKGRPSILIDNHENKKTSNILWVVSSDSRALERYTKGASAAIVVLDQNFVNNKKNHEKISEVLEKVPTTPYGLVVELPKNMTNFEQAIYTHLLEMNVLSKFEDTEGFVGYVVSDNCGSATREMLGELTENHFSSYAAQVEQ